MAKKGMSDFLNLKESPMEDDSIDSTDMYQVMLPNPDIERNPRFNIDYTDQWVLPHNAYLQFTGKVVKTDGTDYAAGDKIALVNNGVLRVFERAIYKIDNIPIETVDKPGVSTFVTALVDYSEDYLQNMGEQLMIVKDVKTPSPTTPALTKDKPTTS